jgi:hypothetical protein
VSRLIAVYLQKNGRHVVLLDSNQTNVSQAQSLGLEAFSANIYTDDLSGNIELSDVGYLLALTASAEINQLSINKFAPTFGETGTFRLMSAEEKQKGLDLDNPEYFCSTHDYTMLDEVARQHPSIQEAPVEDIDQFMRLLKILSNNKDTVPLFLKRASGYLEVICDPKNFEVGPDSALVYLGKPQDLEELGRAVKKKS